MRQVSTDIRVSHHTGYRGTDKDTPQEMRLKEKKCTPNNKEKSSRKREQKTIKFFIVITLQKKNTFCSLQKMCEGQFVFFFS